MAEEIIKVRVELTEMLGSESYVHFNLNEAPVITPDVEELLADTGADAATLGDETQFTARVSSDVTANTGDEIHLAITTGKMHFFDPDSGDRIGYQRPSSKTLTADVAAAVPTPTPTDDSSTDAAS
jgi:multiple sugar transport system ATP-binding protein